MRYEGSIYRPPSEAMSLIVQVTIGCAHNKCTFCSMFKDKKFRVRDVAEVKEDLAEARRMYGYIEKIFLADGDALCLSMSKLEDIIGYINELFTETKSINIYASPKDVLAKSQQDLERLHALGVKILYIGAESGNDKILKNIKEDKIIFMISHRMASVHIADEIWFMKDGKIHFGNHNKLIENSLEYKELYLSQAERYN